MGRWGDGGDGEMGGIPNLHKQLSPPPCSLFPVPCSLFPLTFSLLLLLPSVFCLLPSAFQNNLVAIACPDAFFVVDASGGRKDD